MKISDIVKTISPRERTVIIIAIIAVIFVTSWPYLHGLLTTPDTDIYLANFHRSSGDTYVYYSMIEEIKDGSLAFTNLFTGEEQQAIQVRPFWFVLGFFANTLHLDARVITQIFRVALLFLTIPVIYLVIAYFLKKKTSRLIAFVFSLTFSGFGYLYYRLIDPSIFPDIYTIKFFETPTDVWLTEGYPLLLFSAPPHFQASLIVFLLSLLFFWLGFSSNNKKYLILSGLLNLFLALFHPYMTVYVFMYLLFTGIVFLFLWLRRREDKKKIFSSIKLFLLPVLIALPGALYQITIFYFEPTLKSWAKQSVTTSPEIQYYLLGIGIFLPLIVIGLVYLFTKMNTKKLFLFIWGICIFPLLYIPILFNRRFSEGYFIPFSILATIGLVALYQRIKSPRNKRIYIIAALCLFAVAIIPTNLYNLWSHVEVQNQYKVTPFYLNQLEYESLKWLQDNSTKEDVVLSGHISGFNIPAFSARRVYLGHDLQTANFADKKPQMKWFFAGNEEDDAKLQWLQENNLTIVYYGPNEQAGGPFDPQTKSYLNEVFANEKVQIFRVVD